MPALKNEDLDKSLDKLSQILQNSNSFVRNFFLSIVRGLGFSLGATLVFGLSIAFLVRFAQSVDYVPIINEIVNSESIQNLIEELSQ